jgi:hypothetical protein
MKEQHQGVRSTKLKEDKRVEEGNISGNANVKVNPSSPKKMRDIYIKIHNSGETMHGNQTGCFPATSSKCNQYIMMSVEVDGNYIDAESMKKKSEGLIIKAYLILWTRLTALGMVRPTTHILDNKASKAYKAVVRKNCTIQLIPPDIHCRNLVERAIQTFKNHFKAIIAGVDDNFPMSLIIATGSTHLELVTTIKYCSNHLGIPIHSWKS